MYANAYIHIHTHIYIDMHPGNNFVYIVYTYIHVCMDIAFHKECSEGLER